MPLTDTQREAMSDDQITAWELKAKQGMLSRSPILSTILDKMRTSISQPISGISSYYNSASTIGIATGEGWESYQEGGKLYLDETKLRDALTADPNVLNTIFGKTGNHYGDPRHSRSNEGRYGRKQDQHCSRSGELQAAR